MPIITMQVRWNHVSVQQRQGLEAALGSATSCSKCYRCSMSYRPDERTFLLSAVWDSSASADAFSRDLLAVTVSALLDAPQVVAFAVPDLFVSGYRKPAASARVPVPRTAAEMSVTVGER